VNEPEPILMGMGMGSRGAVVVAWMGAVLLAMRGVDRKGLRK